MKILTGLLIAVLLTFTVRANSQPGRLFREIRTNSGGRIRTLDPVAADDLSSRDLLGALFDTLLEYDYTKRPYTLKPALLEKMPEVSADGKSYHFQLKSGLLFPENEVFSSSKERKITAQTVKFSLLRLADARLHSPLYWLIRGRIAGLDEFHALTGNAEPDDYSLYDIDIPGIQIHDSLNFTIHLTEADYGFLYRLALPNTGIVARQAVEKSGRNFGRKPVGSGPFILKEHTPDYRIVLEKNPSYRQDFFPESANPIDRNRPLPLADRIIIYLIRQPMTAWLLFLQGELDYNVLDKDNQDLAFNGTELAEPLKNMGIKLVSFPEFEIRYIGFNFHDRRLGENRKLRQALSLAYMVQKRVEFTNYQLRPVQSCILPGIPGYDPEYRNRFAVDDLSSAGRLLAEAGFPNGIDPQTGEPLRLSFDQSGTTSTHRQYGELAAADFAALGIQLEPVMNNKPRFYDKLRRKQMQLFRLSWVGDYPDAENFLQLFYSGNDGSCNRTGFSNAKFDRMYEKLRSLPDSPRRRELVKEMVTLLGEECAWIYEGQPLSSLLYHSWLENYLPHDFSFIRWKYLSIDPEKRQQTKSGFVPLDFKDLRTPERKK